VDKAIAIGAARADRRPRSRARAPHGIGGDGQCMPAA
jgi:hypothetical protein